MSIAKIPFLLRLAGCALCGGLLSMAFRSWDTSLPAWFALAPVFLFVAEAESRRRAALFATAFAVAWTFPSFTFLWHLTRPGTIALTIYTSSIYLLGLMGTRKLLKLHPVAATLSIAALWVLLEIVRSLVPIIAFPWLLMGHTFLWNEYLRQGADMFGVYGLSFILVAFNAMLAVAMKSGIWSRESGVNNTNDAGLPTQDFRLKTLDTGLWRAFCLVLMLILGAYAYGYSRVNEVNPLLRPGPVVGVIQGNIIQKVGRTEEQMEAQLVRHMELHRDLVKEARERNESLALICWAETMVPGCMNDDDWGRRFKQQVAESGVPAIAGSNYHYPGQDNLPFEEQKFSNAAYVLDAKGVEQACYFKRRLVAFGEYVPYPNFPLMKLLGSITRDKYIPGEKRSPIYAWENHALALNLCVEDIHPDIAREAAIDGADTLMNVTNDGWFYGTYGPRAHFQAAAWRAIEVRRPMLRITNTGWTAAINPLGEWRLVVPPETEATGTTRLEYIDGGGKIRTLYSYLGESGVAVLFAVLLLGCIKFGRP